MGVSDDKIATGRMPSDEKSRRGRQQTSKYQHGATSNKLQIIFWEKKTFLAPPSLQRIFVFGISTFLDEIWWKILLSGVNLRWKWFLALNSAERTLFFSALSEVVGYGVGEGSMLSIFQSSIFSISFWENRDSNPGRLGEQQKTYLCAIPFHPPLNPP